VAERSGGKRATESIARMLRLAAYFKLRGTRQVTLTDICANVPGYEANFDTDGTLLKDGAWEAVRKKVRRDLQALTDVFGIEVEFDEATQEYRLKPPFLSAKERDVLLAAAALVRIDGIEDTRLAALGTAVDGDGQRVAIHVHRHLLVLRSAIAERTPVRFSYRGTERDFEPWAVGLWHDRWYTVGHDRKSGGQRVFRLDRIASDDGVPAIELRPDDGTYTIPDRFDAVDILTLDPNNWGQDPPVEAEVWVERDWCAEFRREFGAEPVGDDADGSTFVLTVRHYESFRDRILGFAAHAAVRGPEVLVAQLRDWLAGMAS